MRSPDTRSRSRSNRRISSSGAALPDSASTGNTAISGPVAGTAAGSAPGPPVRQPHTMATRTTTSGKIFTLLEELRDQVVDGGARHFVHRPAAAPEQAVPHRDAALGGRRRPDDLAGLCLEHLN